jgi:hypothetical protein
MASFSSEFEPIPVDLQPTGEREGRSCPHARAQRLRAGKRVIAGDTLGSPYVGVDS